MKKERVTYRKIFDTEIFEGELAAHKYPWHFHDTYTVIIIDSGAMEYVFRDDRVVVKQGQVFIVNPSVAHYNSAPNNIPCAYRAMFLPTRLFNNLADKQPLIHFEQAANASVYTNISKLFEKLSLVKEVAIYNEVVNEISVQLLHHIKNKKTTLLTDSRIETAIIYIKNRLDEKLTIAQLADVCNLSHYHFQRLFKKVTGLTVNACIQQCRMEYGKELLNKGKKPVFTSLESGFFDQSHFHKQFKKMYVLTPAAHLIK